VQLDGDSGAVLDPVDERAPGRVAEYQDRSPARVFGIADADEITTNLSYLYAIAVTGTVGALTPGGSRKTSHSYFNMRVRTKSDFFRPTDLLPKRDHNDLALGHGYLVEKELPRHGRAAAAA
jgi:hypothetical protein